MDLSRDLFLIKNAINTLGYFSKESIKIENDGFVLLGFKDNFAVIEKNIEPSSSTNITQSIKKQVVTKFEVDESGDKYINLNGQKLKVVPQGKIPEAVRKRTMLLKHQMINIGSLKNPLKVRVISGATQINGAEKYLYKPDTPDKQSISTNSDKQTEQHSQQASKKIKLISLKGVLKPVPNDSVIHTDAVSPVISVNPKIAVTKQSDSHACDLVPLKPAVCNKQSKLLTKKNLIILNTVKMKALNLSKKNITNSDNSKVSTLVQDAAIQTDSVDFFPNTTSLKVKTVNDKIVQTEVQQNFQENISDPFSPASFDILNFLDSGDSPVINNVNFGTGPTIHKYEDIVTNNIKSNPGDLHLHRDLHSSAVGKSMKQFVDSKLAVSEARMQKKLMFFKDWQNCLIPNLNGNLLIHEGVINNDVALVKRMCAALKARGAGVNLENNNGCTPLQLSVINDVHEDIVQTLLDYGGDVLEVDGEGNTILHLCVKFERNRVIEIVLNHPVMKLHPECINTFNFDGLTPLMMCCTSKWAKGAVLFIVHGANVNLKDQTSGRTALFHAAEAHNEEIVRLLLNHKADPKIKNFFGTSPHDAMYELEEMPEVIKNLIFGKSKKRTIEAEMNPVKTAKAAKSLKTYPRLKKIEPLESISLEQSKYTVSDVK